MGSISSSCSGSMNKTYRSQRSQITPADETRTTISKSSRRKSSSFHLFVKDLHALLQTSDSLTLRKQFGNHFKISSTRRQIEFEHSLQNDGSKLNHWVGVNDFEFSSLLGTGGFGAVFKARRKRTGKEYALKIQPMEIMVGSSKPWGKRLTPDETLIHIERTVLASCRKHPFIVSLEYAFHTDKYAILALEYVPGGTMSHLIANCLENKLPFDLCKTYTIELILALNFMHRKGIIYRDLKPSNILIAKNGHLKITDFGLAGSMVKVRKKRNRKEITAELRQLPLNPDLLAEMAKSKPDEPSGNTEFCDSSSHDPEISSRIEGGEMNDNSDSQNKIKWVRRRTVCGTAGYRAPEQVQERYIDYASRSGYDERADWFALGVCCFTMLTGRRPFPTKRDLFLSDSQRINLLEKNDVLNPNLQSSVAEKLMNDTEFRCLMFEVNFPLHFQNEPAARSFIEALLSRNPDERPRYEGIIKHSWMKGVIFTEEEAINRPIPSWVLDCVYLQSLNLAKKQKVRRFSDGNIQMVRTLSEAVNDLCSEMYATQGSTALDNYGAKWKKMASNKTTALFRHWNYISEDALELELQAAEHECAKSTIEKQRFGFCLYR